MKRSLTLSIFLTACFAAAAPGQAPEPVLLQIVKAEDARAYDATLEGLIKKNGPHQMRSMMAAGRIGDEKAIDVLGGQLDSGQGADVRLIAAFALGEIESIKAADVLMKVLADVNTPDPVRARAVEAAGKVAAANTTNVKTAELSAAILKTLETESARGDKQSRDVVLMALTAALRIRPEKADVAVAKFLLSPDARVRTDAGNTMARLRAKNANDVLRQMVRNDTEPAARANAARALGAAVDKGSVAILLGAAMNDADQRVRVSAIRSLGALMEARVAPELIERGERLLDLHSKSKLRNPSEKSELLEIASALGRLLPDTEHDKAVIFINRFRMEISASEPDLEIALARIAPKAYLAMRLPADYGYRDPWMAAAYGQGMAQLATSKDAKLHVEAAEKLIAYVGGMETGVKPEDDATMAKAMPDLIRSIAAFKPSNLTTILAELLTNEDVFIRTAAAELMGEQTATPENIDALEMALLNSMVRDYDYNDAQLANLDALIKLDKKKGVSALIAALNTDDYVVRKKALDKLSDVDLQKQFPNILHALASARENRKHQVLPYPVDSPTKLGQLLNTNADYRRALARKNGAVKAVLTTEKGTFTIDFFPEEAPLTVDNFIKLARARYFNGVEVHRVVPNFVMQDGDPRGDGNGGPGWSIRCEINMIPFDRGAVGMALSGKDTGGSQWFVTHSPQPHLDGGYTVFGHVNETDMKVVDNIVRGDKILSVRIVEGRGNSTTKARRTRR